MPGEVILCHRFTKILHNRKIYYLDEEWRLLGCYVVWLQYEATFRMNLAATSTEIQESVN
jgi:hypothetical protein